MSTSERLKGKLEQWTGAIKQRFGRARGDAVVANEGDATRGRGALREESAKAGTRLGGIGSQIKGRVDNVVGAATGDTARQVKGKAEELKGKLNERINR
jgi:uncharacterized protein YjbJ (UPF0337 family)